MTTVIAQVVIVPQPNQPRLFVIIIDLIGIIYGIKPGTHSEMLMASTLLSSRDDLMRISKPLWIKGNSYGYFDLDDLSITISYIIILVP